MKKIILIAIAALMILGSVSTVFAQSSRPGKSVKPSKEEVELDFSLVWASAPVSGFDSTIGFNIGAGIMLPQIDKNVQGRIDIGYYSWSYTYSFLGSSVDLEYTRIPITAGGRLYIPVPDQKGLRMYVQGGLEVSFDDAEAAAAVAGVGVAKVSKSEMNIGITPGAGIEFRVSPTLSIGADLRYHLISDSYFTLQAGVLFHF